MNPMRRTDGSRVLISVPVPMAGIIASIYLPKDLTQDEAERVKALIDSLVTVPALSSPETPDD